MDYLNFDYLSFVNKFRALTEAMQQPDLARNDTELLAILDAQEAEIARVYAAVEARRQKLLELREDLTQARINKEEQKLLPELVASREEIAHLRAALVARRRAAFAVVKGDPDPAA